MNDGLLQLGKNVEQFKSEYPDDRILSSSTGFIVKRIRKGDRKKLGFPSYANHSFGVLIFSDKRAHFANRITNTYTLSMLFLFGFVFALSLMTGAMLVLMAIFISPCLLILILPLFLMLFLLMLLTLKKVLPRRYDMEWKDMRTARMNTVNTLFSSFDMVDIYNGKRTVHICSYSDLSDELKDHIKRNFPN